MLYFLLLAAPQLPNPPGPGIISSRYCLCSCSAACRWISNIWFAADWELAEPLVLELEVAPPVTVDPEVWVAPNNWAMARAWYGYIMGFIIA